MSSGLEEFAHIEQVRFDRVFDVQGADFSFESGGQKHYAVRFSNDSVPAAGALYAVALIERGNWQQIVGWRDLATAKVLLRESAWSVAFSELTDYYLLVPIFVVAGFVFVGPWGALAALALFVCWSVYVVRRAARRNRLVDAALRAVHPAVGPGPGGRVHQGWRRRFASLFGFY